MREPQSPACAGPRSHLAAHRSTRAEVDVGVFLWPPLRGLHVRLRALDHRLACCTSIALGAVLAKPPLTSCRTVELNAVLRFGMPSARWPRSSAMNWVRPVQALSVPFNDPCDTCVGSNVCRGESVLGATHSQRKARGKAVASRVPEAGASSTFLSPTRGTSQLQRWRGAQASSYCWSARAFGEGVRVRHVGPSAPAPHAAGEDEGAAGRVLS